MVNRVQDTGCHSWRAGRLAKGCRLCVQGRKLVLFITGHCSQRCFYCPVSEHKFGRDVVFANEWKVECPDSPKELLEEARLTGAKGAGITGGDPLADVNRCCDYIRLLKQEFGNWFHIHLYTPLMLVTKERLAMLHNAGLDEIRFHPNLDDDSLWNRLCLAKKYKWAVGVEIPVIPGYEEKVRRLIDFISGRVDFLNLNELELSDTQAVHYRLHELGFVPKDGLSYGAKGSQELGLRLLDYASRKGLAAHFCTARLKDAVQLRRRMQLRARNVALPFDIVQKDGTLVRGCAYLKGFEPGTGSAEKARLAGIDAVKRLHSARDEVLQKTGIASGKAVVDERRLRLLLPIRTVRGNAKRLKAIGFVPAIVEEYPTADALEVEVEIL
jgi:hypothetical protein